MCSRKRIRTVENIKRLVRQRCAFKRIKQCAGISVETYPDILYVEDQGIGVRHFVSSEMALVRLIKTHDRQTGSGIAAVTNIRVLCTCEPVLRRIKCNHLDARREDQIYISLAVAI